MQTSFFSRLSIQARLRCIAGVMVLGMGISGAAALVALQRSQQVAHDVLQRSSALSQMQTADMAHDALRSFVFAAFLVGQLPQITPQEVRDEARAHSAALRGAMAQLAGVALAQVDGRPAAERADRYVDLANDIIALALIDRRAAQPSLAEFQIRFEELRTMLHQHTATLRALNEQSAQHAAEVERQLHVWVALATALTLALMAAVMALVGRSIRHSLQGVEGVATAVAAGDLERRTGLSQDDEVGRLGRAVDAMADKLQQMLDTALADARRHNFGNELNTALEMADSEPQAYRVVQRAMQRIADDRPMELLVSDSSQAALQRATEHPRAGAPGCGVESPFSCQAVRRGHTALFPDSEALDACPKLRERVDGVAISAVCVPLHFMGRAMGVLHSTGPVGAQIAPITLAKLKTLGTQAAARIGVVRAFERSQLQAATDATTGLANRRALEAAARELLRKGQPFALVMADLDRFKLLNDTYGHLVGDQALRLFAETLKRCVRGADTVSRWGGEEFAVLLAGASATVAADWAARARAQLAAALKGGQVPAFTASFGVADSTMSEHMEELLRIADEALYVSKEQGRDRATVGTALAANEPLARQASEHAGRIDVQQLALG